MKPKSDLNIKLRELTVLMQFALFTSVLAFAAVIAALVISAVNYDKTDDWDSCNIDTDCTSANNCTSAWCDRGECKYFEVEGCCVGECTGEDVTANYQFDSICINEINVCNNITESAMMNGAYSNYAIGDGDGTLTINGNLILLGNMIVNGTIEFSNITFAENSTLNELFNSLSDSLTPNVTVGSQLNGSLINSTVIKLGRIINVYLQDVSFDDCDNETLTTPDETIATDFLPYNPNNGTLNFPYTVINNGVSVPGAVRVTPDGALQWLRFDTTNGDLLTNFLGECGFDAGLISYFSS